MKELFRFRLFFLFTVAGMILLAGSCTKQIKEQPFHNPLSKTTVPFIGAQVFIEPGQTREEINSWFRAMKENNLTACRIRMFESYMRDERDNWDFSLFDQAFMAAEVNGIMIWATLYPVTGDNINIGGDKFPRDKEKEASIARYIDKTVNHFKSFRSLAGWVLINEPGIGGRLPENEYSRDKYLEWEKDQNFPAFNDKGYPVLMDFKDERFLLDHTTWFLRWIADEIKKHDRSHDLHVNNHNIFVNCAEYDFPGWRGFLTSLGGSAHASWHFRYFSRDKYAVAMSADCEMIHSGAGDLPWFMTELQGGNNTYSGFNPMCPTREEITQWLWITVGTESKGAIFWTLNPRASGIEAGEWGLLDFQDKPTDRLLAAGQVAGILSDNAGLFSNAKKVESRISILYSRESVWAERKMAILESEHEARRPGAVMKSVLAWFEALSEMGISPELKAMNEFDFSKGDYAGRTMILSHQLSLPSAYADSLEHFVAGGGKLIVDGLTAYFDENMHNTMKTGFSCENLFGGNVSEFKFTGDIFHLDLEGIEIPAHLWKGYVVATTGEPICNKEMEQIGVRNRLGEGEVVWIPSLLGLGSRMEDDYSSLQGLLGKEAKPSIESQLVRFQEPHKKMLMKTLVTGDAIITIVVNKNEEPQQVNLLFKNEISKSEVLFPGNGEALDAGSVLLQPEETIVILNSFNPAD